MPENLKQTVMPFVRLLCAPIATVLAMFNIAVDADTIFTFGWCAVALASYIWSWWKNNNLTKAAKEAQEYLDLIKNREGIDRSDEDEAKG